MERWFSSDLKVQHFFAQNLTKKAFMVIFMTFSAGTFGSSCPNYQINYMQKHKFLLFMSNGGHIDMKEINTS